MKISLKYYKFYCFNDFFCGFFSSGSLWSRSTALSRSTRCAAEGGKIVRVREFIRNDTRING